MKKIIVFASLLITIGLNAQTPKTLLVPSTPEAGGFSSERLKRLDIAMNEWVQKGYMNGAAAFIARDGKIVYYKGIGYNDLDSKAPLPKDGIFRIASQTKAITSVAVMILFDEGRISLNDPVSKYIPSIKNPTVIDKFNASDTSYTTVPATREVTIKDLLTHTSGLGYAQIGSKEFNAIYAKNNLSAGLNVTNETLLSAMTRLGTLPLMHQPGSKWTYGLNVDVLGCIVEIVSGISLSEFFKTRIFDPLGMKDSYFQIPQAKGNRLVNLYTEDSTGHLIKSIGRLLNSPAPADYPLLSSTYYSGGAGLSSPIYDYAIFLQMLLNGGTYNGKRIIGLNTVRMMTSNQIGDLTLGATKFGLGFEIATEKSSASVPAQEGTFGWGGAFSTSYWVDPKQHIVILFYRQLQASTHYDTVEKFRALAYQALND